MKQKFLVRNFWNFRYTPQDCPRFRKFRKMLFNRRWKFLETQTGIFLRMESVPSHNWFWFDLSFVSVRLSWLMSEQLFLLQNYEVHWQICLYLLQITKIQYINFHHIKYTFSLFICLFTPEIIEISIFILYKISTQLFLILRDLWIQK